MMVWKTEFLRIGQPDPYTNPVNEIVFKRHNATWLLPLALADHLRKRCNPNHLPKVQHVVHLQAEYTVIWEIGSTKDEFDRVVLSVGKANEEYYVRMSIARINDGHCGSTPTPLPPSPYVQG